MKNTVVVITDVEMTSLILKLEFVSKKLYWPVVPVPVLLEVPIPVPVLKTKKKNQYHQLIQQFGLEMSLLVGKKNCTGQLYKLSERVE